MSTETDEDRRAHEERSAAGRQAAQDKEVVSAILATPNGRYWMERALEFCQMYDATHTTIDDTLIKLGRRQVGAFLMDQIEQYAPDAYLRMIGERRARLEQAKTKKADEEKRQKKQDGIVEVPTETYLETLMDQQARELSGDPQT